MPKKKMPRATGIDYTTGIEWTPVVPKDGRVNSGPGKGDGVDHDNVPGIEVLANKKAPTHKNGRAAYGKVNEIIQSQWPNMLKAAENGYEFSTIAKAIGISERTFQQFMQKNPAARQQLVQAKLKPRDLCVAVILNAAKSGQWLPAAWWLERTCWQEFARPEVKLQLMDRQMNQSEVVQTFGGKSLQQINQELRDKYGENPNFGRAVERSKDAVAKVRSELGSGGDADAGPEGGPAHMDRPPDAVLD